MMGPYMYSASVILLACSRDWTTYVDITTKYTNYSPTVAYQYCLMQYQIQGLPVHTYIRHFVCGTGMCTAVCSCACLCVSVSILEALILLSEAVKHVM